MSSPSPSSASPATPSPSSSTSSSLAQHERRSLCDTFERVGPDAPTLCAPWLTRDLAAHLVMRERRPDAAAGLMVPPLAGRAQQVQDGYAAREWGGLVDLVRSGPPAWSPTRLGRVDELVNGVELFVHHEDVLRAAADWAPRQLVAELESALWANLSRSARALLRRSPVGVVLVAPGHGRKAVGRPGPDGRVVLEGQPAELLLYAFGRTAVARVDVHGSDAALDALGGARLGF